MVSRGSPLGLGGYMSSYGYDDETLQKLKEEAAQDYKSYKEDQDKKDQISKIVNPIEAYMGGFGLDLPGALGAENYTFGPGVTDAIDIQKRRYREDGKLKFDSKVIGAKEGLEQFVDFEGKQNPNLQGTYQDLLTGKYYNEEGKIIGEEEELRDYVRDIAREGRAYGAGEISMIALDVYGAPAFIKSIPTMYKAASPYVKRLMQGTGLLALTTASTDAEAKSVIKKFNSAVKAKPPTVFDNLSPSVQKKLENTFLNPNAGKVKSKLSPGLLANQEIKDLPTDMASFWKKSQELEVYKNKKWTDLSAEQRGNFKKKYDRFIEKGISVDDIVITRDKKRLIYPETYNTKSLYPYSPSHEPVAGGSRIRSSGVEFSHLKNGEKIESRFDKMVRAFYQYPMNSRDVPEKFNIQSFNKYFFGGEKSDDYVSNMVSAYARDKGITRPVIGTDDVTKYKREIKAKDIKENGNYTFENKIGGDTEINLHHSATKKKPYTSDDLMYIDSFVNQEVLETFEKSRNKLLNKQKIALNKYVQNPTTANKKVLENMNDEFLEIIGNENTYGLLSAPLANFKKGQVFLSEFKFTSPDLKKLDTTGIFKGKNLGELNLLEQVILDFNRPLKTVNNKGDLIKGKGELLTNKQFVSQFDDTIEGPLDASIDYIVNRKTVKTDPFFRAQQKTYLQQNPGKNSDDAIEAIKKYIKEEAVKQMNEFGIFQVYKDGGSVKRDGFVVPGTVGDSTEDRQEELDKRTKPLFQEYLTSKFDKADRAVALEEMPESQRKQMAFFLEEQDAIDRERVADASVRYRLDPKEETISSIRARIAEEMVDAKPTKFPLSSFPKLLSENPVTKSMQRQFNLPFLILGDIANSIQNQMGGDEKTFAERYPVLAENLAKGFTPVEGTDPEAKYIDGIDEINRALETGVRNLGFNTMDLVLGGIDLTGFGDGKLSERLRKAYEETPKNDPETFMGDLTALLVEFGVPGGLVTKLVTRMQKAMRIKGFNTMTRYIDDDVTGGARFAMNASNVAKRMGTGAVIFGAADAIGGGPYNSLTRMLPDDATLLPGKPIDTTDLSGKELALANMKNRIRFGADGAMIGGLFPLLGPPAWALTKTTASLPFKTIPGVNRSIFGGALQLAGVPLKIAADSLAGKIPYTNKTIPLVGEGISYLGKQGASLAQKTAAFMGKQVFTRAALGLYDAAYARASIYTGVKPNTTMFTKNLPDFQDWRKFSVNSKDPLHQYLAKIDNKLAAFRDIGKMGKDAFGVKTQSDLYIRAKSRAVEKYLIDIERIAYKLAKGFEERHQKYGEFETIQKKYLDDVLGFLEGKVKLDELPKQLQVSANDLRNYTNGLKKEFGELLPTTDPIKYLIDSDINAMMRRSFAAFTNNSYAPTPQSVNGAKTFIKDLILGNNTLRMEAEMAFPNKNIADAIDEFASLKVADIMHTAKYEMSEPFKALETITRKLGLDDITLRTGEELPTALRKLLGEEKNLRSSLLQTTGNIIASTSQKKSLDRIAEMGLANGWLFRTQDEALGKGILNAASLSDVKGSGFLLNDAIGLYGTPELIKQLGGYSLFDGFLKSTVYQNILAMKAMVQGGKTLYSPATQMRNVGSAALFALNVGHIGGSASVPQAFKIVMDDIFGPGRNVDKKKLNKFIERKIELGVIDENVVSQELTAILNDLKGATKETGEPVISNLNQLIQRVGNTQLSQYVQRLYAGGDNLWKLYGHEFYISELKQFTKSIDDVKRYFDDIIGKEFVELSPKTGVKKTVMEGIEEIAAHLVRDTYPTYSRVPPAVQAIRKLPLGNFISFPAEMLRTTATTLSTSLKHIASGNPGLQSMGYRSLFGQFTTLYGVNEGVKALGHSLTDVSPEAIRAYQDGLGPRFMENHLLVPLTNRDPKTGEFKAFDLSSYNPYAYVIDPIEGFIRELGNTRMSVDQVEGEVYNRIFDAAGPLMAFIEPFTAETIVLEPFFDIWARGGKARSGKTIYSPTDDFGDKVSKSFQHILNTVAPGFVRSTGQVLNALSLDTKQGRLNDLSDVLLRLIGGSITNIDPVSALDYKAIDIREIRSNAYKTEHFFSKENALERGPAVMAAEFQDIQNEALAAQFEVYKMFAQALDSGLLTRDQIEKVLGKDGRNVPNLDNLMDGIFTPVSYSESGLEQRADELYDEYKKNGISINRSDLMPFGKLDAIIFNMETIKFKDLEDPKRTPLPTPSAGDSPSLFGNQQESEPVTPPLPDVGTPVITNNNMNNNVNPATGLTTTETALLSPGEQAIRQRQKGIA